MTIKIHSTIPILRIFDVAKAKEFYQDFLGFSKDWDHRFETNFPLYQQISRDGLILHLSEHHGDGSPGVHIRVMMSGIADYHAELHSKQYRYMKPGLENGHSADAREMSVIDPFGNRITFVEQQGGQEHDDQGIHVQESVS
jgi:catechol 2,3-dioxygenase-like lactoylglutathione lyase family enzyme